MSQPSTLLRATDVAELLSMNVSTVWRNVRAGKLPAPIKVCGSTWWRRSVIEAPFADPALDEGKEAATLANLNVGAETPQ